MKKDIPGDQKEFAAGLKAQARADVVKLLSEQAAAAPAVEAQP